MKKWLLAVVLALALPAQAASVLGDKIRAETIRHTNAMNAIATEVDTATTEEPPVDPPVDPPVTPPNELGGSPNFLYNRTKTIQNAVYGTQPAKGEKRLHAATGAEVRRVSSGGGLIVYSRYTPVNYTNQYIVIHGENSTSARIENLATGALVRNLPTIGENNEIRWHYGTDFPNRFYYVQGNLFKMMDAVTGVDTTIRDFSSEGGNYIGNDVEGDSSNDSRYWVFMSMAIPASGSYYPVKIFTYDRVTNTILGRMDKTQFPQPADRPTGRMLRPNMVDMAPDGSKVVILWERAYSGNNGNLIGTIQDGPHACGLTLTLVSCVKVAVDAVHTGWAVNSAGAPMFVSQNNRNDWIEAVNLTQGWREDGVNVLRLANQADFQGYTAVTSMHFAKLYTKRGYVLVSTAGNLNDKWGSNQLFMLPLVNNAVPLRVSHTFNIYPGNEAYRNESSAAMSYDGNGIYWTSNWGLGTRVRDSYEIRLPIGWSTH